MLMKKMDYEFEAYIQKLKCELDATFGSGTVSAHIEISPVILCQHAEDDDNFSMVSCDLLCDAPSAGYDINIIVQTERNFEELDSPRVTSLEEAKNLAMLIAQQVQGFQIYP
ncbi:hypothetical protein C6985_12105 [Escherichia coli]|nr:hypothetical protein C6985_12105 [Escherichia coli]